MQAHIDENNSFDSMNTFEFMMSVLLLTNEESLITFEKHLLDINLKKKIVSYKIIKCITITIIYIIQLIKCFL